MVRMAVACTFMLGVGLIPASAQNVLGGTANEQTTKIYGTVTDGVETIIGANVFKDLFASIRDIVGGRAAAYERTLTEAKDTAMKEMEERAAAMGANAIVGIDIDYETAGQSNAMLMVATSGTAVVI